MLDTFLEFWRLENPNVVWVLSGSILLGISAGMIGCFTFLEKRSLAGDALAHAALPGVTTAFLLFGSSAPAILFTGAVLSCIIGYLVIEFLTRRTKVKQDSALAIVLSVFFAFGIFQLTQIQHSPLRAQAGLDRMLFGQAASLVAQDMYLLIVLAVLLCVFVVANYPRLKLILFDRAFAQTVGVPVKVYDLWLGLAIVVAIVLGLQLVGVVLMAAMVLTPAATARYWTSRLSVMLVIAGALGAVSGLIGTNISYLAPRMPTGPWMVVSVSGFFILTVLFAPSRGIVSRLIRRNRYTRKIHRENILRTVFKSCEEQNQFQAVVSKGEILQQRSMQPSIFRRALRELKLKGFLRESSGGVVLTEPGLQRAREVTRFHRLWELYLTERMRLALDHVHEDAEEIEHIFTPELERKLLAEIGEGQVDPHGRAIPSQEI